MPGHALIRLDDEQKAFRGLFRPFGVIPDRLYRIKRTVDLYNGKMSAVDRQAFGRFDFAVKLLVVSKAGQPDFDHGISSSRAESELESIG
ncbi:hypothetical protein D3C84_1064120 [compost metagenome]